MLLLVGAGGLWVEIREHRRPGYVPMSGRSSGADSSEALQGKVLAVRQIRDGQAWIGGGSTG